MTTLPDEFRVNHRAASESLLRAAASDSDLCEIKHELEKATYFENEALRSVVTQRQRALAIGLLHAVDLLRAVAYAEFNEMPAAHQ
jgi:hypothetical protein